MTIIIKWIIYFGGVVLTLVAGFYLQAYGRIWLENRAAEQRVMALVRAHENETNAGETATMRRALIEATIDFYNLVADDELLESARSSILWGVEHEGIAVRAAHHADARAWVHDSIEQSRPFYRGVYTWEQGVFDAAHGDQQRAYETLGHVLRLVIDHHAGASETEPAIVQSMIEQDAEPITFESIDDYFNTAKAPSSDDPRGIVRLGVGVIALFEREAEAAEEIVSHGGNINAPPTMYTAIPTLREITAQLASTVRGVVAKTPRVIGVRPEAPVAIEGADIAEAATNPLRPLTHAEAIRLGRFVLQSIGRPYTQGQREQRRVQPQILSEEVVVAQIPIEVVVPSEEATPSIILEPEATRAIPPSAVPKELPPPNPPPIVYCCSGGGGGGGGGGSPTPPPQQAPSTVNDLRIQEQPFITNTVTLLWTAPSDADTAQTSLTYDLRTATTTPITDTTSFASATAVAAAPTVGAVGAAESFVLVNITPGATYTVALRTSDGTNPSALSNIVTFTTLPKGDAPSQITDFAMVDEYIRYPLTLQWSAPTDAETNYTDPTPQLSYEIRYATSPITDDASWALATLLTNPPAPASPGTVQAHTFIPPAPNAVYSIAIRMSDGYQLGEISNLVAHTSAWFGTIATPTTWAATISPIHIVGATRFDSALTIEPGVVVQLGEFTVVTLAAPLTAAGTAESGITLTSFSATPAQYWQSLIFDAGSTGSTLSYVTIEKGGNVDGTLTTPMIDIRSGTSAIDQATIQSGLGAGIAITFPARPTLTNVTTTNNAKNGIWYTGTLDASYTLPASSQPVFTGTVTVASGATFTISDGTVVKMDLGALLIVDGGLTITGALPTSVSVTSIRDDTLGSDPTPSDTTAAARGDWQVIRFRAGSSGSIVGASFYYGGKSTSATNTDAGMMAVENATVLIDNFTFTKMNYGIEVHGALANVTVRRSSFYNSEEPLTPVFEVWNNPDNVGTVHYTRIGRDFATTALGNASVEYITIENKGSGAETLTGWKIHDLTGNTFTFPEFILDANASVKVHTNSGTNNATDLYWGRGIPVWNDSLDFATLLDSAAITIDEFAYSH